MCVLLGQHSRTNSRDVSAMDTLPLNGNFNSSYSLDDAAFEKMIISELVHNNLRPRGHPRCQDDSEQLPIPERRSPGRHAGIGGAGGRSEDNRSDTLHPNHPNHHNHPNHPALELLLQPHHREVLDAPLLPQRTHSLLYSAKQASRQPARHRHDLEDGEERKELDGAGQNETTVSLDNRDSVYTSMPELRDSSPSLCPHDTEDECPLSSSGHSDADEPCNKSTGDSGVQPASYYHISESCTGHGIDQDECPPPDAETPKDGQMQLITSL